MKKAQLNNLIRDKTEKGLDQLMFSATVSQRRAMATVIKETMKGLANDIQTLENPIEPKILRLIEIEKSINLLEKERANLIENL